MDSDWQPNAYKIPSKLLRVWIRRSLPLTKMVKRRKSMKPGPHG